MNQKAQDILRFISVWTAALLLIFGTLYLFRQTDDVNIPFINDPKVLGNWVSVEFVENVVDFSGPTGEIEDTLYLRTLDFRENGEADLNNLKGYLWSKGCIVNPYEQTTSQYMIKEINGRDYLFYEWKSGDYRFGYAKPQYYVFERKDN